MLGEKVMRKRRIFLLQESAEANEEYKRLFAETGEFEVVGSACDGITGLELIEEKKPSFVVMGLALSGYEGLGVIERIVALGLDIKIIVVSAMSREEIIQKALDNRVSFVLEADGKISVLYINLNVTILIEFYKTPISELHIAPPYHWEFDMFIMNGIPWVVNPFSVKKYPGWDSRTNFYAC